MKEEMYNEKELKALEDEIRAMGIPYSANEPDDRYFANFRVRLMERIEAKEQKQNIFLRYGHGLRHRRFAVFRLAHRWPELSLQYF